LAWTDFAAEPLRVVEAIATGFGLACVALSVRQSPWTWPTGLVMVSLYLWIFLQVRLYSGAALQAVYVALNAYGWWAWLRGGEGGGALAVSALPLRAACVWLAAALAGGAALGVAMDRLTDADLPYLDAAVTALSLAAQWLMARKHPENWLFWIAVNLLSVGMYATKELWLSSGLYAVFLLMAVAGWFAWRRTLPGVTQERPA
jgi:nicotinamide mononucleotide transporter